MNPLHEFYIFSALLWGSLAVGAWVRHGRPGAARWTAPLLKLNAMTVSVLTFLVAFWRLDISHLGWRLLLVPGIGMTVSVATLWAGRWMAQRWNLPTAQYGAFVFSSAVSNVGITFGIPLCFAVYGLDGLALSGLYVLYFPFFVFVVIFTLADRLRRAAAGHDVSRDTVASLARGFFRDPFRLVPILAIVAGLGMNLWKGKDAIPEWVKTANHLGLYLGVLIGFLAVGFSIHAKGLWAQRGKIVALCGLKFLVSPLVGVTLALLLGFHGKLLVVIAIESACPVAISAVMTSAIYNLDQELAGGALIASTALATAAVFTGLAVF